MLVEQLRGRLVESWHRVHAAVVDGAGQLVAGTGDPALVTFWRSAAKPFQAVPLVEDGAVTRFGVSPAELALCSASHSSEPAQVALVRELLAKVGVSERDLVCGAHTPLSEDVARDYATRGVRLTAVYSNCSGKHSGMLALARHHGWPTHGYAQPDHPVQERCLAEVSRWSDVPAAEIGTATDGCGVVCFALPLTSMALAYARAGRRDAGPARQVIDAMLRYPELVAGRGRPCSVLMQAHPGRVVAKVGAEGVYCALLLPDGLGVALKVEDGDGVAAALALAAVLEQLGLRPRPPALAARPTVNTQGRLVGELRVTGGLEH